MRALTLRCAGPAVAAIGFILALAGCQRHADAPAAPAKHAASATVPTAPATYVGSASCRGCHGDEYQRWQGSQHAHAMQLATAKTVQADFNDQAFGQGSEHYRFIRDGAQFAVEARGPNGKPGTFAVRYTFGVDPLQQYLVALSNGRLQALPIAWDTRPAAQGGQRWFSLYPGTDYPPGHPLHWTGVDLTWNFQCAGCHSTNVRKGYNPDSNSYDTRFSEIDVACEACHGPGSRHLAWAARSPSERGGDDGLAVQFHGLSPALFKRGDAAATAHRVRPRQHHVEIDTCGRCHARRSVIAADREPGQPLGQSYRVALLRQGLYFPDGQNEAEVYVYGSFLQSKMYAEGVSCSNCHDPHSGKLRVAGDGVCLQCHSAKRFATPKHHFHAQDSAGARCVNCHMPERTYMGVDKRRDHSFRIPRPDLTEALGVPNSCNDCHADHDARWAVAALKKWYGGVHKGRQRYGRILAAARAGAPGAQEGLLALLQSRDQPAIARATAASELASFPGAAAAKALANAAADDSGLVRRAVADAARSFDQQTRLQLAAPLLTDDIRAVRIAAGYALADMSGPDVPAKLAAPLGRALDEYRAAQMANADRPEAWLNLADLASARGNIAEAETDLHKALAVDPWFVAASVNLADLYRRRGNDADGEQLLRAALARQPDSADLHYALGLLLVRIGSRDAGIGQLAAAWKLAPESQQYGYVYALALSEEGRPREALDVLDKILASHQWSRQALVAYVTIAEQLSRIDAAAQKVRTLIQLEPDNPRWRHWLAVNAPGSQ